MNEGGSLVALGLVVGLCFLALLIGAVILAWKRRPAPLWLNRHGLYRIVWRLVIFLTLSVVFAIAGMLVYAPFMPGLPEDVDMTDFTSLPFSVSIPNYVILSIATASTQSSKSIPPSSSTSMQSSTSRRRLNG